MGLLIPDSSHAAALAEMLTRNRDYFATGEPARSADYYTEAFQRGVIEASHQARAGGTAYMWLIVQDGQVVGRMSLNSVIRGAFQSASVGYVIDREHSGRGLATDALRLTIDFAFREIGLHRLQGETLVDNHASQAVLQKCGFTRYGTAPKYLCINGEWSDHELFQLICGEQIL